MDFSAFEELESFLDVVSAMSDEDLILKGKDPWEIYKVGLTASEKFYVNKFIEKHSTQIQSMKDNGIRAVFSPKTIEHIFSKTGFKNSIEIIGDKSTKPPEVPSAPSVIFGLTFVDFSNLKEHLKTNSIFCGDLRIMNLEGIVYDFGESIQYPNIVSSYITEETVLDSQLVLDSVYGWNKDSDESNERAASLISKLGKSPGFITTNSNFYLLFRQELQNISGAYIELAVGTENFKEYFSTINYNGFIQIKHPLVNLGQLLKNEKIEEFCAKFVLNDYEKNQILYVSSLKKRNILKDFDNIGIVSESWYESECKLYDKTTVDSVLNHISKRFSSCYV